MTKMYIDSDEWYPVYTLEENTWHDRYSIDVDDSFLTNYKRIMSEFNEMQTKLEEIVDGYNKPNNK